MVLDLAYFWRGSGWLAPFRACLLAGCWALTAAAGELAPSPVPPEIDKIGSEAAYSVDLSSCLRRSPTDAEELLRRCTFVSTSLRGGPTFQMRRNGVSQEDVDTVHSAALEARAAALLQLGRTTEALTDLVRAAALNRRAPWVLNNLGVLEERRGNVEKAIDYYGRALKADDGLELARTNLSALTAPPAVLSQPTPQAVPTEPVAQSPKPSPPATTPLPEPQVDPDLVRRVQRALAELGHSVGPADGLLGARTQQAIRAWQRSRGITVTGTLDETLAVALEGEVRVATQAKAGRTETVEARPAEPPPTPTPTIPAVATNEVAAPTEVMRPAMDRASEGTARPSPGPPVAGADQALTTAPPVVRPLPKAETATAADLAALVNQVVEPGESSRVALVIGNGGYLKAPKLDNPINDARDMAAALQAVGFEVVRGIDLDRAAMEELSTSFARTARDAEMALVFYAGHGVQVAGRNYLLPIDAELEDETDLRRAIALDTIVEDAGRASKLALVIVDACRDNPLAQRLARSMGASRSTAVGRGLASPGIVPRQTMIAYSTQADATAADGTGRNSPFTAALLKHMIEPGVEVRLLFGKVRDTVVQATRGRQDPPIYGALGGEPIYLVPPVPTAMALDLEQLAANERRALQRSLRALGFYRGLDDGSAGFQLRGAVRDYQLSQGAAGTGRPTAAQLVELHNLARYKQPPAPLPAVDLIEVLQRSEAGDAEAELLRGQLHDTGFAQGPLPKSNREAVRWYERAALQGETRAAALLGLILEEGNGVEPAPETAAQWLLQAAEADDWRAQAALGELYRDGRGVAKDGEAARQWLEAAARHPEGGAAMAQLRLLGVR